MALGSRLLEAAVAVLAVTLLQLGGVRGHGFMLEPRSRNVVRNWQYCPHCVSNGGTGESSNNWKLTWPAYKGAVCGAPDLMIPGPVFKTYASGSVVDLSVHISAHHGGRHQFRLCPKPDVSEGCLDQHVLQRADGEGKFGWTPTHGGAVPGADYRKSVNQAGINGDTYTWRYRLPQGVTCERCVLQYLWTTANSCQVPGAPSYVGSHPGMAPCTSSSTYPEQFFNCADISITGSDGGSVSEPQQDRQIDTANTKPAPVKPTPVKPTPVRPTPVKPSTPCGVGCARCMAGNTCTKCEHGYHRAGSKCMKCASAGCLRCPESTKKCNICDVKQGYVKKGNSCVTRR